MVPLPKIAIGVQVHAEPERLQATLESLQFNTFQPYTLLILADGHDQATQHWLAAHPELSQSTTAEPLGSPACFNRLISASEADLFILLESGAQVGPDWLDFLLAALAADPSHGLAGPSTNSAWNEQGQFFNSGSHPAEIAQTARLAATNFGNNFRTLEPLYSLADFCYAVKREVVEAIGEADEAYGLGPCWEMDYNIRAARAGFKAVWACGAYVHRAPFTVRRQQEEARRFEANKRYYQDKFCGLRLQAQQEHYEPHCRGENCQHFAPANLIQIQLPLKKASSKPDQVSGVPESKSSSSPPAPIKNLPLISCIMPTAGRPNYVRKAVEYFQRQDYPNLELIILDDATYMPPPVLPKDSRIKYLKVSPGLSIGTKRNRACELAQGEIIAHWDDDDWYAPNRLSVQAAPLLTGEADICGLKAGVFFDLTRWEFWQCSPQLHRQLFVEDVHGGTLVFRRQVWEQLARYPDVSLAEDAFFLYNAVRYGARLCRLPNQGEFVYLRHDSNSWAFPLGYYLDPAGWEQTTEPELPAPDRAFYAAQSPAAPKVKANLPLVSCIMPTCDRRAFVPAAISYFQRQDYPNKELLILDDGTDPVADLVPSDPQIRYIRLEQKLILGAKRNLACQMAQGEIIAHWDDDDWSAPNRLSYQVQQLESQQADLCGVGQLYFYDPAHRQAWLYEYPPTIRPWVAGNTLCYRKRFWEINPFPEIQVGEDTSFVWNEQAHNMLVLPGYSFYVALVHSQNTSQKITNDAYWQSYPVEEVERLIGPDLAFYQAAFQTA